MINLFHKKLLKKNRGAATLIITVILLVTLTLIVIFAAGQGKLLENITANQSRNRQAFQAAEAGLEYGINYLTQNSVAILANPVNGYIPAYSNSNTNNVSWTNGSAYTITYSNPVANNYKLIKITSTGRSDDSTSTRVLSQNVQFGSVLANPPNVPFMTKGALSMGGNATIVNTSNTNTVQAGGGVALSGSSQTVLNSGTSSTPGHISADIQQNIQSLNNMSQSDFFATVFGVSTNTVKNDVAHYYSNSSNTNYSATLNGMTGTSIWIDQTGGTAALNGSTTIGSSDNPVLLIVNGNIDFSGNVTINGFVFVIGSGSVTSDITGSVTINGGITSIDDFNMTGHSTVNYNPTILSNLQKLNSMMFYAKVPGTWKDF